MKKIIATMSVFAIICMCVTSVYAAEPFEASITFTISSSSATIFEAAPPNSSKELSGTYETVDALGAKRKQAYSGYIARGQLNVKSYATDHFKSYKSYFSYKLDGLTQPNMVSKTY